MTMGKLWEMFRELDNYKQAAVGIFFIISTVTSPVWLILVVHLFNCKLISFCFSVSWITGIFLTVATVLISVAFSMFLAAKDFLDWIDSKG